MAPEESLYACPVHATKRAQRGYKYMNFPQSFTASRASSMNDSRLSRPKKLLAEQAFYNANAMSAPKPNTAPDAALMFAHAAPEDVALASFPVPEADPEEVLVPLWPLLEPEPEPEGASVAPVAAPVVVPAALPAGAPGGRTMPVGASPRT